MLINLFDKILFGSLLICCMQLPLLADHYLQYLVGYTDATQSQVAKFSQNALQHGYKSVDAMLDDLDRSESSVVREDAKQKRETIVALREYQSGIDILKDGHYFSRIAYILKPSNFETLSKVSENFKMGIPLTFTGFSYSALIALILSQSFWLIAKALRRPRKPKQAPQERIEPN